MCTHCVSYSMNIQRCAQKVFVCKGPGVFFRTTKQEAELFQMGELSVIFCSHTHTHTHTHTLSLSLSPCVPFFLSISYSHSLCLWMLVIRNSIYYPRYRGEEACTGANEVKQLQSNSVMAISCIYILPSIYIHKCTHTDTHARTSFKL